MQINAVEIFRFSETNKLPNIYNKKGGIYKIINDKNDKIYFGSTKYLSKRYLEHKNLIYSDVHRNYKFQKQKNIKDHYIFVIIELSDDLNYILKKEQFLINSCDENILLNINKNATSSFGIKRTIETKNKISNSKKGKSIKYDKEKRIIQTTGKNNPMYNKKHSNFTKKIISEKAKKRNQKIHPKMLEWSKNQKWDEERKIKMSEFFSGENSSSAKLTKSKVLEIKSLINQGKSNIEISKMFNVSFQNISNIKLGKTWKNI